MQKSMSFIWLNQITDQENKIDTALNLPKVLERINDKLVQLEAEQEDINSEIDKMKTNNYVDPQWFKKFCFYILEHFEVLLKDSQSLDEIQLIFSFLFQERPTVNQIVNRTPNLYPIFALNNKKEPQLNWSSSVNLKWQPHLESNQARRIWNPEF